MRVGICRFEKTTILNKCSSLSRELKHPTAKKKRIIINHIRTDLIVLWSFVVTIVQD